MGRFMMPLGRATMATIFLFVGVAALGGAEEGLVLSMTSDVGGEGGGERSSIIRDDEIPSIRVQVRFSSSNDAAGLICHAFKRGREIGDGLFLDEISGYALEFPVDILDTYPDLWWCRFTWLNSVPLAIIEKITVWEEGSKSVTLKVDNIGVHFYNKKGGLYELAATWESPKERAHFAGAATI